MFREEDPSWSTALQWGRQEEEQLLRGWRAEPTPLPCPRARTAPHPPSPNAQIRYSSTNDKKRCGSEPPKALRSFNRGPHAGPGGWCCSLFVRPWLFASCNRFNLQESQLVLSNCCVYLAAAVTNHGLGFSSSESDLPNQNRSRMLWILTL